MWLKKFTMDKEKLTSLDTPMDRYMQKSNFTEDSDTFVKVKTQIHKLTLLNYL